MNLIKGEIEKREVKIDKILFNKHLGKLSIYNKELELLKLYNKESLDVTVKKFIELLQVDEEIQVDDPIFENIVPKMIGELETLIFRQIENYIINIEFLKETERSLIYEISTTR